MLTQRLLAEVGEFVYTCALAYLSNCGLDVYRQGRQQGHFNELVHHQLTLIIFQIFGLHLFNQTA